MISLDQLTIDNYNETDSYTYSKFTCGNARLDHVFHNLVGILERKSQAKTTLFFYENELVGFCTLLVDRISVSNCELTFPDGDMPHYYPSLHVFAFAVDSNFQESGIGSIIFDWILAQGYTIRENIGLSFLALESYNDERLIRFYTEKFDLVAWKYLEPKDDLVPLIFDFRGLDGQI
ncbi:GNAT family N-acetyltransferase [Bacillus altitudinis]|uniref:GNAT family N-acetyltransferase n=1 Tax=Bacillus altitudinis TaxID=293387 RepID=UPI003F7BEC43